MQAVQVGDFIKSEQTRIEKDLFTERIKRKKSKRRPATPITTHHNKINVAFGRTTPKQT